MTTVENALSVRVNSALLLAQAMNLDMTNPTDAQKVLRHLSLVEKYVRSDTDE
jgi:hypothetical protein